MSLCVALRFYHNFSVGPEPIYLGSLGADRKSIKGVRFVFARLLRRSGFESVHLNYGAGIVVDCGTPLIERVATAVVCCADEEAAVTQARKKKSAIG